MNGRRVDVRTTEARLAKYWLVRTGLRFRFPRLRQIRCAIVCRLRGHEWRAWVTDDYDGPGELLEPGEPDSFMPYTCRPAWQWEAATRSCGRGCGCVQFRGPAAIEHPNCRMTFRPLG